MCYLCLYACSHAFISMQISICEVSSVNNQHTNRSFIERSSSYTNSMPTVSERDLNECYLYHGTQANKLDLCEEGLDSRLSFQGCFGRGIYFR